MQTFPLKISSCCDTPLPRTYDHARAYVRCIIESQGRGPTRQIVCQSTDSFSPDTCQSKCDALYFTSHRGCIRGVTFLNFINSSQTRLLSSLFVANAIITLGHWIISGNFKASIHIVSRICTKMHEVIPYEEIKTKYVRIGFSNTIFTKT